jgi:hypothetical protein
MQCATDCYLGSVSDGVCNPACNNDPCGFDGGDCDRCAPGCPNYFVGNFWCDAMCNVASCNYDEGDCDQIYPVGVGECSPGCKFDMIGDGSCDLDCYTDACWYDFTDCAHSEECPPYFLGDLYCDHKCMSDIDNLADLGDCGSPYDETEQCADHCSHDMLWNGVCDCDCYNEECLFDFDDCKVGDCNLPVGGN